MLVGNGNREGVAKIFGLIFDGDEKKDLSGFDDTSRGFVLSCYKSAIKNANLRHDPYEFPRLKDRLPRMTKFERVAVICDFALNKLAPAIRASTLSPENTVREVLAQIDVLKNDARNVRVATDDILTVFRHAYHMLDAPRTVDAYFLGEFIGYRRSVNYGDLVHFYVRIYVDDSPNVVRFENHYYRGSTSAPPHQRVAEGIGFQVGETLYMDGNAHDGKGKDTRGLRSFGLQRLETTDCLVGPVMTVDPQRVPMAARIVLVPVGEHHRWLGQERIERAEMRKFVEARFCEAEILGSLAQPSHPFSNEYLLSLVNNTTTTVLRGKPRHNQAFLEAIETLKQFCEEQGMRTIEDAFIEVMKPYRRRMELAPKGT